MKKTFVTGAELARRIGISRAAVTKAVKAGRLHRDQETEKYDLNHPTNEAFLSVSGQQNNSEAAADSIVNLPPDQVPISLQDLYRQKLEAEVRRTEATAFKIEMENAKRAGDLVTHSDVEFAFSAFTAGIKTYFLRLPDRIARGNVELRNRTEKEIKKSIEKIIADSQSKIKQKIKKLNLYGAIKNTEEENING